MSRLRGRRPSIVPGALHLDPKQRRIRQRSRKTIGLRDVSTGLPCRGYTPCGTEGTLLADNAPDTGVLRL